MTVKIVKCDIDWREIKNLCRTTMGKNDTEVEPTDEFKEKLLLSEHSPIRHSKHGHQSDSLCGSEWSHW